MKTTYRLKSYELTEDFLKKFKENFKGKDITITVKEPYDETAYLLSNETNRKILLEAVEAVKQKKFETAHIMTIKELEELAK